MGRRPRQKRRVTCEVCGRQCQTERAERDICRKCIRNEPVSPCIRCGRMRHLVAVETGLCPLCVRIAARPEAKCARCGNIRAIFNQEEGLCEGCNKAVHQRLSYQSRPPQILCSVCGQMRKSVLSARSICGDCSREERNGRRPCARCNEVKVIRDKARQLCERCSKQERWQKKQVAVQCSVCGKMRISALFSRAICQACLKEEKNGRNICAGCKELMPICNQAAQLCMRCYSKLGRRKKQARVTCSVCAQLRVSALIERPICIACLMAERNGCKTCAKCNKLKVIYHKGKQLCKHCQLDELAPKALQKYLSEFTSPYPYNERLFHILANTIDWSAVDGNTLQQYKVFGRFLQTYEFRAPLGWAAIEEALPSREKMRGRKTRIIRSCLLELGYLLVAKGELESREAHTLRRNALTPLKSAPEFIQPLLHRYTAWLWERQNVPTNVGDHLEVLVSFWSWCHERGIRRPEEIQSAYINDYLIALYWQWQCSACQNIMAFDPSEHKSINKCNLCGATDTLTQVKRYSQNTVRQYKGKLLVFFDWAKLNRLVIANPVQRKVAAPKPTIHHYSPEVIKTLCVYLRSSDAHPIEALILYLIIFHACSVWELRHAQVPTLYQLQDGTIGTTLAESYFVLVPRPEPSLGDRSPGRFDITVKFPDEAAPWLRPLLERYEHLRQRVVKNANNRYLLFSPVTAPHNIPVGITYVQKLVRRASMRVLAKACAPNILRKTAGILFADRAGAGVLRFMGWDSQQAFQYTSAARKMIHPREIADL